ncbi:helix-turn-helix domain-containing protein [Tenacibaculum finnmarkense]|uniref:Helix-turn-helix domain-containing protein n=1 Tax=Tenacibaculum finnmarkense genomovar ulcerans TaxID=2781388 RepID=A0A2I2M9S1_9FLAO|nr:helix-turn-helix domain-containing protein [Tenacibaculum finnmarkense]MCD8449708.1 helix-turn-helix domain-containing protein [Tenacibaculum dicentrarchi]MCD8433358.1 helix-turn-helix domain-containing protein [Tenacibaculum finnmarkense genomovar ulcerans]MCG8185210.1 helix-turn-helix domain-containing protein [Tenacibaculum finnmarkense genomovar finnmarkense]MCG8218985.1 helix-turn-helix domain-containing protein [Tenacibaculum finnmarkense genomovar finnmarkense]MCG8221702.1 helix-turn
MSASKKIILEGITSADLVSQLAKSVKELLTNEETTPTEQTPEFWTRQQTADFLSVSLVTLFNWNKKGILKTYRVGTKVFYRKSDVLECLKKSK